MKFCNQCGNRLEDNVMYCPNCGASQIVNRPNPAYPAVQTSEGKGQGIASCILGSMALATGIGGVVDGLIMLVMEVFFFDMIGYGITEFSLIFSVYPLIFGILTLIVSVIAIPLACGAISKGFRKVPAKLGKGFGIAGLCLAIATLMMALIIILPYISEL